MRNGAEVHWHLMLMSAFLKITPNLLLHGIHGENFFFDSCSIERKKIIFHCDEEMQELKANERKLRLSMKKMKIWYFFPQKFWSMTEDRKQTSFIFTGRNNKNKQKWIPTTKISFEDFFIWCNSFHSPQNPNEKEKENQIRRLTYGNYWFICGPKWNNNLSISSIERLCDEVHVYDRTHEANHWHFSVGYICMCIQQWSIKDAARYKRNETNKIKTNLFFFLIQRKGTTNDYGIASRTPWMEYGIRYHPFDGFTHVNEDKSNGNSNAVDIDDDDDDVDVELNNFRVYFTYNSGIWICERMFWCINELNRLFIEFRV